MVGWVTEMPGPVPGVVVGAVVLVVVLVVVVSLGTVCSSCWNCFFSECCDLASCRFVPHTS